MKSFFSPFTSTREFGRNEKNLLCKLLARKSREEEKNYVITRNRVSSRVTFYAFRVRAKKTRKKEHRLIGYKIAKKKKKYAFSLFIFWSVIIQAPHETL